jgi:hypothetical protein
VKQKNPPLTLFPPVLLRALAEAEEAGGGEVVVEGAKSRAAEEGSHKVGGDLLLLLLPHTLFSQFVIVSLASQKGSLALSLALH